MDQSDVEEIRELQLINATLTLENDEHVDELKEEITRLREKLLSHLCVRRHLNNTAEETAALEAEVAAALEAEVAAALEEEVAAALEEEAPAPPEEPFVSNDEVTSVFWVLPRSKVKHSDPDCQHLKNKNANPVSSKDRRPLCSHCKSDEK